MWRGPRYCAAALVLATLLGPSCAGSVGFADDATEGRDPAAAVPMVVALADWPGSIAQGYLSGPGRITRRLGDEVRGGDGCRGAFSLSVLTPPYTGVTLARQPTLQWFLGAATGAPIEVELWSEAGSEPLLAVTYPNGLRAGIHALALADHRVELEPDAEYEWSVAVLCEPDDRAGDIVSVGTIRRVLPPSALARQLDGASLERRAELLVEYGIWYDALEALAALIDRHPPDGEPWRSARARLLDQVGLPEAAYEP
jgi:Domain of Unknown Function (DUF928)